MEKNTWNNLNVVHFHGGNGDDRETAVDFALLETAFMQGCTLLLPEDSVDGGGDQRVNDSLNT